MFNKYEIVGPYVTLHSGHLRITPAQAARRAHQLTALKKRGEYDIKSPVTFKRGEIIEYGGTLPKSIAADLEAIEKAAAAKDRAAAEARQKEQAEQERLRAEFLAEIKSRVNAATQEVDAVKAAIQGATDEGARAALETRLAEAQARLDSALDDLGQVSG